MTRMFSWQPASWRAVSIFQYHRGLLARTVRICTASPALRPVGRGGTRAFAYLLTESRSQHSEKRLAGLVEFSRLGAGIAISEHDLDLRRARRPVFGAAVGPCPGVWAGVYKSPPKVASKKADDDASDLWVPDRNLPLRDALPESYMQSAAVCPRNLWSPRQVPERRGSRRSGAVVSAAAAGPRLLRRSKAEDGVRAKGHHQARRRAGGHRCKLPARAPGKAGTRTLQRDGDRVACLCPTHENPFDRVEEFLDLLDK